MFKWKKWKMSPLESTIDVFQWLSTLHKHLGIILIHFGGYSTLKNTLFVTRDSDTYEIGILKIAYKFW